MSIDTVNGGGGPWKDRIAGSGADGSSPRRIRNQGATATAYGAGNIAAEGDILIYAMTLI